MLHKLVGRPAHWRALASRLSANGVGVRGPQAPQGVSQRSMAGMPEAISDFLSSREADRDTSADGSSSDDLTPRKIVEALDRHIVGQHEAKRAVAVALRNRWRRHKVPSPMREEIVPKNILMIGPTGCGKTEIARRLAKLADAPFVKVEATKFTEVGFHGRDVDQIIRDLVDNAINLQKQKVRVRLRKEVQQAVEEMLLDALQGPLDSDPSPSDLATRRSLREQLRQGNLEDREISLDIAQGSRPGVLALEGTSGPMVLSDLLFKGGLQLERFIGGRRPERRQVKLSEGRQLLEEVEMEKHLNSEQIIREAVQLTESDGIVFIDEIDKIVTNADSRYGADASSEGVQRDLLPIIEGSTVTTKYGNVNTDHILFICSGAFHSCKPSDMLAELQGRLPIRVELRGLTQKDLYRILTEPETNMIKQQQMLMATERIDLTFTDAAIHELARVAAEVNRSLDNIGARRLHTIIERVTEDISFNAPDRAGQPYAIDREDVRTSVGDLLKKTDLSKYVL